MFRRLALLLFLACVAGAGLRVGDGPRISNAASIPAAGDSLYLVRAAWADSLPDGSLPSLQDRDSLNLVTTWSRDDLVKVHVNLTTITSVLGEGDRVDSIPLLLDGAGRFTLRTLIPANNERPDGIHTIYLTAVAADTTVEVQITRCLSNSPPSFRSASTLPIRSGYRGGDILRIETEWQSSRTLQVSGDFRSLAPALEDSAIPAVHVGNKYVLTYPIPLDPDLRAPDGVVPVLLRAADPGCGVGTDTVLVNLANSGVGPAPTLLEWTRLDTLEDGTPRSLENRSTLRVRTRWDQDGLRVWADLRDLAPRDTSIVEATRTGTGEYLLTYTLPDSAPRADADQIPFCLAASREGAHTALDCSILVCLDNFDPVHVRTFLREGTRARRGGDTLHVVTKWESPSRLPLSVGASFARIQPALGDSFVPAERAGDSLLITYRIPPVEDDRGDDGMIVIPIRAREVGGCGETVYDSFRVLLDTTPPDSAAPVLDALPAETTEDSISVSGTTVPEAFQVALTRQGSFQKYVVPDPSTGRFSGSVRLLPDEENQLRAWAEDSLRNRTRSSDPQIVLQVSASRLTIPEPFDRGSSFSLRDPGSIHELVLDIFDLEGSIVRRFRVPGPTLEVSLAWDGNDEDGVSARQGYYLVRARWRDKSNRSHEADQGLVLAN